MQNHDLRTLPAGKHLRSIGAFVFGALCAFQVSAAPVVGSSAAFDAFMWLSTGGASQTVGYGAGGTLVAAPSVPMIDTDGGMPRVSQSGTLKNPSGNPLVVNSAARVSAKGLRDAAFSVIKHGTGPLLLGVALWDLAKAVKYYLARNSDGTIKYQEEVESSGVATEYNWTIQGVVTPWFSSPIAACSWFSGAHAPYYFHPLGQKVNTQTSCGWEVFYLQDGTAGSAIGFRSGSIGSRQVTTATYSVADRTEADFLERVASTSGWPSTSFAEKVLADPLAYKEGKIELQKPTLTGPSTSQGTSTVTNNTTNNTTKTETVTHQHTYQGDTVNTTTVTVVNVVDNSTGDTVSNETKTETPVVPEKAEDPCIANPNRNGCRSDEFDTPVEEIPRTTKTITFTPEDLGFAGGTCPANRMLTMHQSGQTVIAGDWATTCDKVTTYAKPLILLMATFAALMIIFGGGGRVES